MSFLSSMPVQDLCRLAGTCNFLQDQAAVAAEYRCRQLRAQWPAGSDACPCWLRCLATMELLHAAIGPPPSHSWREEHIELQLRVFKREWESKYEDLPFEGMVALNAQADLEPGGILALDTKLEESKLYIVQLQQLGWNLDDAQLTIHIAGVDTSQVLMESFTAHRREFAATLHSSAAAYTAAALRDQRAVAPTCYNTLDGLVAWSPEWARLPSLALGESFFCAGSFSAREPLHCFFPNTLGMCEETVVENELEDLPADADALPGDRVAIRFETIDAPIVRIISSAADRHGFHSLVQDGCDERDQDSLMDEAASWSVPMLSTVTLIAKHGPGQWELYPSRRGNRPTKRPLRVQQPLFTVHVSFG